MKKLLMAAFGCLFLCSSAQAVTVSNLYLGGTAGLLNTNSIIVNTGSFTDNGVTFDAQFQVQSTGGSLTQGNGGLGVDGSIDGTLNPGETIEVSFLGFSTQSGAVTFDGFEDVTLTGLSTFAAESGVFTISGTPTTVSNNGTFAVTGAPNADTITLSGVTNADPTFNSSFRFRDLSATFTGVTGVPEPGSFAALSILGLGVVTRRRRKR